MSPGRGEVPMSHRRENFRSRGRGEVAARSHGRKVVGSRGRGVARSWIREVAGSRGR